MGKQGICLGNPIIQISTEFDSKLNYHADSYKHTPGNLGLWRIFALGFKKNELSQDTLPPPNPTFSSFPLMNNR